MWVGGHEAKEAEEHFPAFASHVKHAPCGGSSFLICPTNCKKKKKKKKKKKIKKKKIKKIDF